MKHESKLLNKRFDVSKSSWDKQDASRKKDIHFLKKLVWQVSSDNGYVFGKNWGTTGFEKFSSVYTLKSNIATRYQ